MAVNVFVSYSHDDAALVTPIVKLLRVNKALVFQDLDSIELGKRWREQAGRAVRDGWDMACRSAAVTTDGTIRRNAAAGDI